MAFNQKIKTLHIKVTLWHSCVKTLCSFEGYEMKLNMLNINHKMYFSKTQL